MNLESKSCIKNRIWEIDMLRFIAIVLMVIFHLIYDLNEFLNVNVDYEFGFWYYVGAISGVIFIFVSGISSGLSRNSFKRGLKVLGFGMIITIGTYFFDSSQYIRFGILHFLGVSMMLFPLLKKINNWALTITGIVSFAAGKYIKTLTLKTFWLLPLGFTYEGYASYDYYPLLPYIFYFILGILCYKLYYYRKKSLFNFDLNIGIISKISKKSLTIYLVHQPVFIGIIYLLSLF